MSELRFDGRVAVVTGAGAGLGRSHARLLADRGTAVVVNDIDADAARATVKAIIDAGGSADAHTADITQRDGAASLVETALARFGRIDIVVNNAGALQASDFGEMTGELFERMLAVNLSTAFHVARNAWPHLAAQGYGRIVSTTSNSGLLGTAGSTGYAAAKAGVWGLTRSLAWRVPTSGSTSTRSRRSRTPRCRSAHESRRRPGAPARVTTGRDDSTSPACRPWSPGSPTRTAR
ncbi:MAG: SDR family NAD(P)-dependent oxidoreductase [Acidimicrobiia bacterium]